MHDSIRRAEALLQRLKKGAFHWLQTLWGVPVLEVGTTANDGEVKSTRAVVSKKPHKVKNIAYTEL